MDIPQTIATGSFVNAGTFCPQMPLSCTDKDNDRQRSDPASSTQPAKYPIPSFFEYRVKSKATDIL
jgi:hypothetical protein